jgi:chromosome segregation ATPase
MQTRDPRDQVIEMLRSKAEELKAPMLAALATQVGDNPRFKKITQLIEDMILKLQNEAAEEETHNGFCVKQTKLAEEKRDMKAATITKLNSRLAKSEAKRDKLTEQIATLEEEIAELEDSLAKQTKIRGEEKEENASVISDAEAGRGAVEKAIEILDRFYKTAANKTEGKTFIQVAQGPTADDIPDGGFDAEYGASQDDSVGILGMLDVIQSDFVRTETETAATEKEQAAAFLEFSTTTKASLAEKNNAKQNYNDELTNTKESITKDTDDMASNQSAFDASIAELVELHAACVDTGMSYEERVQRREDEIAALKDAYSILDSYSPA